LSVDGGTTAFSPHLQTAGQDRIPETSLSVNRPRTDWIIGEMAKYPLKRRPKWGSWVTPKGLVKKSIHRWYVFPHSFTSELVHQLIADWGLDQNDHILDPFAGAGTTLLAAKEKGIP